MTLLAEKEASLLEAGALAAGVLSIFSASLLVRRYWASRSGAQWFSADAGNPEWKDAMGVLSQVAFRIAATERRLMPVNQPQS